MGEYQAHIQALAPFELPSPEIAHKLKKQKHTMMTLAVGCFVRYTWNCSELVCGKEAGVWHRTPD